MTEHEMIMAAVTFIKADVEYVRLIERAVDFDEKPLRGISRQELSKLRKARRKKAELEEEMYRVFTLYAVEGPKQRQRG